MLDRRIDSTGLFVEVRGSAHDPRTAEIRLSRQGVPLSQRAFTPGPPRCPDFHNAVALAIALMIKNAESEPEVAREPVEPASAAPVAPSADSKVSRAADATPDIRAAHDDPPRGANERSAIDASRQPWHSPSRKLEVERGGRLGARVQGLLGYQVGTTLARGFAAAATVAMSRLELQVGLLGLFSTRQQLVSMVGFRTRALAASAGLALHLVSSDAVQLRLSLGMLLGRRLIAVDDASDETHTQRHRWAAGTVALELGLPVFERLCVSLSLGPVWSFQKRSVRARDEQSGAELGRRDLETAGVLLGLGLIFEQPRQGSRAGAHR